MNKNTIQDVLLLMQTRIENDIKNEKEEDLEKHWRYKWDNINSIEENMYNFYDMLDLYSSHCKHWEEIHNGMCCLVERVRDKYIFPKIKLFIKDLQNNLNKA